jgi:hypothetical protein
MVLSDIERMVPSFDDGSLTGYQQRVALESGDAECGLVLYNAHCYDDALFLVAREFLAPYLRQLGLPPSGIDVDIFSGNYRSTPTGIHTDSADNFSYVVDGKKTYAFWPNEAFSSNRQAKGGHVVLGTRDFERSIECRDIVTADAGEIVYWPASYWHIGLGSGSEYVTTVNVALYNQSDLNRLLQPLLSEIPSKKHPLTLVQETPAHWLQHCRDVASLLESEEASRFLQIRWLERLSADGFDVVPGPAKNSTQYVRRYSIRNDAGAAVVRRPDGRALVVANGLVAEANDADAISVLLRALSSEGPLSRDAIALLMPDSKELDGILDSLLAMRAIRAEECEGVTA